VQQMRKCWGGKKKCYPLKGMIGKERDFVPILIGEGRSHGRNITEIKKLKFCNWSHGEDFFGNQTCGWQVLGQRAPLKKVKMVYNKKTEKKGGGTEARDAPGSGGVSENKKRKTGENKNSCSAVV